LGPTDRVVLYHHVSEVHVYGSRIHWRNQGGGVLQNYRSPSERNLRITDFADTMTSKFLRDSRFSLNPPLNSAADQYIGILKSKMKITNI